MVPAAGNGCITQPSCPACRIKRQELSCSGRIKRQENRTGRRDAGRERAAAVVCLHVRGALRGRDTAQLACSELASTPDLRALAVSVAQQAWPWKH